MNKEVREWRKQRALENPQTPAQFINVGKVIEVDGKYLTDDGRVLYHVYVGKNHSTSKWICEGENHLYRNFFEAYHGYYYD